MNTHGGWVLGSWGALASVLAAFACSAPEQGEQLGSASAALSADQARILGFEATQDWSAPGGAVLSSEHVEGTSSLSLPGGYAELRSVAMSSLGSTVTDRMTVDIKPPSPTNNPYWAGDVQAWLDLPAAGINGRWLGQFSLSGLPNGQFSRVTFTLPADVVTALRGTYSNLQIKLALNTPGGSGRYLVDRLSFGNESAPPGPSTPPSSAGTPVSFSIVRPKLVSLTSISVGSASNVFVGAGADVLRTGGVAVISNLGAGGVRLEPDAVAGDVWSTSSVELRDRVHLLGAVHATGTIRGNGTLIDGGTPGTAGLQPLQTTTWQVEFASTAQDVNLEPDQTRVLAPGRQRNVRVASRAVLDLRAGRYLFDSLTVEPDARLRLDQAAGPVVIYTKDSLQFRGITQSSNGSPPDVLFVSAGSSETVIDHPFNGFVVTPNGKLTVRPNVPVNGAVFGKSVEVGANVTLTHRPIMALLPELGLDPTDCAYEIQPSAGLSERERNLELQLGIMRYCSHDGLTPCLAELTARDRLDSADFTGQVLNGLRTPGSHIAFLRSRAPLLRAVRNNEAAACTLLAGDADDDLVLDANDACPGTPSLTVVQPNGCPSTAPMPGPTLTEVLPLIKKLGFSADERCWRAPAPPLPSPLGAWRFPADPSKGKAIWISQEPQDSECPYFVQAQVDLVVPQGLRPIWVSFEKSTSVDLPWITRPAQALQFNIFTSSPSGLAAWADYTVYTNRYRVRSINSAGRRSQWSEWFRPGNEPCLNGYCSDFNPVNH